VGDGYLVIVVFYNFSQEGEDFVVQIGQSLKNKLNYQEDQQLCSKKHRSFSK
jgi:hypothetical protein